MKKANDKQVGGNHYRQFTVQHWDYAWDHRYDQFQYCITKYVDRWKFKNGLEDLRKAQHHLAKYIEVIENMPEGQVIPGAPASPFEDMPNKIEVTTVEEHARGVRSFVEGEPGPGYTNQDR